MVMRRRVFMTLGVVSLAAPFSLLAQPTKVRRLGCLGNSTAALESNLVAPFLDGLHELGSVVGRNLEIA